MANILVLNAGSSSEKMALYSDESFPLTEPSKPVWSTNIKVKPDASLEERTKLLGDALEELWSGSDRLVKSPADISVVGHRVVHGGPKYERSVIVDQSVKDSIAEYAKFAPLQNPYNLLGIQSIEKLLGAIPQIAVFDTAFHSTLPPVAHYYPVPRDWVEKYGIRRYGFHGTSHFYVSQRAAYVLKRPVDQLRTVSCHLGNGCSLAAVNAGKSIDTTMGMSTLEGLMMGTRCGSIDPGISLYLAENGHLNDQAIDSILYHQSGLLGISGISNDMREIEQAIQAGDKWAKLAYDMFVDRLSKWIASMAAALRGVEVIAFTAGIGENSASIRKAACDQLAFLGITLDAEANDKGSGDRVISAKDSRVTAMVIQTQEEWVIAHDCWALCTQQPK